MNLIVFDLELNRYNAENIFDYHGAKQSLRGEIIQIGAVKIDEQGMVLDTFKANLRPQIYRRLSPFVAKVTGFTQKQMDAGMPMQETLSQFVCWCGADATLLEWGMDDVPVLRQNLFLYAQDEQWPYCHYDLQQIFTRQYPLGEGDKLNLESVITRLALPVEREYHDALSDALYTADICRCLDLAQGIAEYPDEATQLRLSMCSVPQTQYRDFVDFGLSLDREAWDHEERMQSVCCPDCGRVLVHDVDGVWIYRGKNSRYSIELCPEDGGWLVRYKRIQWDGLHWNFARVLEKSTEKLAKRWGFDKARHLKQLREQAELAAAAATAAETTAG